jgi:hypothetical protein
MTKRRFALILIVSALLVCGGCGDDDDDDTTPPPLGGGVCQGCPCDYFDVAMTRDCWVFPPNFPSNFHVGVVGNNYSCGLTKPPPGLTTIEYEAPNSSCTDSCIRPACNIISSPPCSFRDVHIKRELQGQAQIDACRQCLEQYVAELNATIPVNAPGGLTCPVNP